MSPDEAEKAFCFVGFFSQTNEAVKSLFSVGGNQKHYDHPHPPPPAPQRTGTINANSRRGQKVNCENKKIEVIMTIQKTKKTPNQQFVRKTVYSESRASLSTSDSRDTSEWESGKEVTR